MKTRREHLKENLTQEEFNKVLSILEDKSQKELILETLCEKKEALLNAFTWNDTPQGYIYWDKINFEKFN